LKRVRRAAERGRTKIDWLDSKHTFSFGEYFDPKFMGFRSLRVINDDIVEPGQGFGTHGHRDMEIVSIVLEGALEHRDDLGNGDALKPGEVQVMSAGHGIRHSEFNPDETKRAHFLQIWIEPDRAGLAPFYAQKEFAASKRLNRMVRVAGPERAVPDEALPIHQDADVWLGSLENGRSLEFALAKGRAVWIHVVTGTLQIAGESLTEGDAIAIEEPGTIALMSPSRLAEFVLFDLA
jgi:redox-sensitive bicupin YhaK (pirin superfamily)